MEFARHSRPQTTAGYTRTTKEQLLAKHLSHAQLISEREAVSALEDMGASKEEIDLVQGITAVVRRRV